MKKEYISPMIGAETIACGAIMEVSLLFGGEGNDMTSDAPARKGNPLNGKIDLN